jgi:hypothetical protein
MKIKEVILNKIEKCFPDVYKTKEVNNNGIYNKNNKRN